MKLSKVNKHLLFYVLLIIVIIVFSLPSIAPLFHSGFFQSDDGEWMIIRFASFYSALKDLQFPVRYLPNLNYGYGYPVANFLYPGFMYLATPIHVLGFGFVDTIKIIFILSMVGSAVFCYLWLLKFFDKLSSFVGALFYLYTPYHLFDLYKRGSVGEVLSLAVVPFLLWQLEKKNLFWSAIGIAFLILSHNTLSVLFLGLILAYISLDIYVSKEKKGLLRWYFPIIMFGLGISSFFWIPAFFELQYTVFSQIQISEWYKYFAGADLIGLSTIFILLLTAVFFVTSRIQIKKHRLTLLLFIIGLVSFLFSSPLSTAFWKILPVSFIQFPFRFLSLTIVCVSFLVASILDVLNPRHSRERSDSRISNGNKRLWTSQSDSLKSFVLGAILIILLATSAFQYLKPSEFFNKGEGFYATNMDSTTVRNEYMPKWVKEKPVERFVEKVEIVEGLGTVKKVSYNSKKIAFDVSAEENMEVRINTIYYPGWSALVYPSLCHPDQAKPEKDLVRFFARLGGSQNDNDCKGEELVIDYSNEKGVMELVLPKGEGNVELTFSETPLRLTSNLISILSLLAVLFLGFRYLRKSLSV